MTDGGQILERVTGAHDVMSWSPIVGRGNTGTNTKFLEDQQTDQDSALLASAGVDVSVLTKGRIGGLVQQITETSTLDQFKAAGLNHG